MEIPLGGAELGVGLVKPGLLHRLVGKGLGGAHAGEGRLDLGVDGAGLGLGGLGRLAHAAPLEHDQQQEEGHQDRHHQRQTPLHAEHDDQGANDGDDGNKQILRAVVRQLRHLEKVGSQAAHQLARAVFIVEGEAHLLHVGKEVTADVGLHPDAEGVAPVADHEVEQGAHQKHDHDGGHGHEKNAEFLLRQPLVHGGAGNEGEQQVHQRNAQRAQHVQSEQLQVGTEIGNKDPQQRAVFEIFGGHRVPPFA